MEESEVWLNVFIRINGCTRMCICLLLRTFLTLFLAMVASPTAWIANFSWGSFHTSTSIVSSRSTMCQWVKSSIQPSPVLPQMNRWNYSNPLEIILSTKVSCLDSDPRCCSVGCLIYDCGSPMATPHPCPFSHPYEHSSSALAPAVY